SSSKKLRKPEPSKFILEIRPLKQLTFHSFTSLILGVEYNMIIYIVVSNNFSYSTTIFDFYFYLDNHI
ncbi:MAG TPA: hypothetical protein VE548_11230, partial [Nitrososphaeraceae archaeon]|nr:hypothetical protein [Nitrososphaeraceae archaeon]